MFWIIIGAILSLVVLVMFIFMFTSQGGKAGDVIGTCEGKGGECFDSVCGKGNAEGYNTFLGIGCEINGKSSPKYYCCSE